MTLTTYLSHDDVTSFITDNLSFLRSKGKAGIKHVLHRTEEDAIVDDVLNETIVNTLSRHYTGMMTNAAGVQEHHTGKTKFATTEDLTGYLLNGFWFNYRNRFCKQRKKKVDLTPEQIQEQRDNAWLEEFDQYANTEAVNKTAKQRHHYHIDTSWEADQMFNLVSNPTRAENDQALTDDYYAELYAKLFQYLDDCVADGLFKFDEVNVIYRLYILNSWSKLKLVEESGFKKSYVFAALKKIQEHLKTVDWFMKPIETAEDDEYESGFILRRSKKPACE